MNGDHFGAHGDGELLPISQDKPCVRSVRRRRLASDKDRGKCIWKPAELSQSYMTGCGKLIINDGRYLYCAFCGKRIVREEKRK